MSEQRPLRFKGCGCLLAFAGLVFLAGTGAGFWLALAVLMGPRGWP